MENKIGNTTQRQTEQIEGSRMWEKTQKKKKNGGGRVEEKKEENKGGQVMVPWTKDTKEDDRSSIGTERSPQDVQTF